MKIKKDNCLLIVNEENGTVLKTSDIGELMSPTPEDLEYVKLQLEIIGNKNLINLNDMIKDILALQSMVVYNNVVNQVESIEQSEKQILIQFK